jgi:hypothetical protein
MKSGDLLPESAVAGDEERILTRIPTQKMWGVHVVGVSVPAGPYFVEQKSPGRVDGAVQVESKAAFFFSRGPDQCAQFCFEESFLPFAGTQNDDLSDGFFWQFSSGCHPHAPFRPRPPASLGFSPQHSGGDCSANRCPRKE